ncbi:hypothetical protein ACFPYJ_26440 [Paenibacillus solisilvae]|uniref:Uncharacterized protein n=1 Tax=Paenibacillus solisilvae TaxID=2486751 RepID=A0ABW0W790_9BACL
MNTANVFALYRHWVIRVVQLVINGEWRFLPDEDIENKAVS